MGLFDFIGMGGSGARNTFEPKPADITNPFGTNVEAQKQVAGAQQTSAGLMGQQGALAGQLVGKMDQTDPRVNALAGQLAQGVGGDPRLASLYGQFQGASGQADPRMAAMFGQFQQGSNAVDPRLGSMFQQFQQSAQGDPRYAQLFQQATNLATGQGPNPAQQQFQQNLNQAIQQQAGGVASVRGLNPALAARMAAQGGASMMQGAAGQAATLQAQQQLAGQQQQAGILGQLGAERAQFGQMGLGAAGQIAGLQQQYGQMGAGMAGQMAGLQQGYGQLAAGVAGQDIAGRAQFGQLAGNLYGQQGALQAQYGQMGAGMLGQMGGQGLTQQQILQAAIANQNAQRVSMQQNINQIGAGVAAQNAQTSAGLIGGLLGGAGSAMGMLGLGGGAAGATPGVEALAPFVGAAKGGRITRGGVSRAPRRMAAGGIAGTDFDVNQLWTQPPSGSFDFAASAQPDLQRTNPLQPVKPAAPGKASPQSSLGKQLSGAGEYMGQVADKGLGAFQRFAPYGPGYAPPVIGPQSFARGGDVGGPPAPGAQGPAPVPGPGSAPTGNAQLAAIARSVAESLGRTDPKAAAIVYADLTGLPANFSEDDTRQAYRMLALHNAALLSQPNGSARPPVPPMPTPRRASRRPVTTPEGEDTIPLKRAMGGATFARDGRVPGRAEVDGDSERNDKVPAMLSPGEIVVPRSIVQSPDAPEKAAGFVAHLVAKKRTGFDRVRRA